MPQINILNILQGDNQSTIVDKVNYNFDQILSAGGGPQGQQGLIGPTGPIGPQGAQGVQGIQGPSGTKWFVQDTSPASGGVTGSNPWTYPTLGDYWLDPDSSNQDVYVFTATGWVYTGYGLAAGDIFQNLVPINIVGGSTGSGILIAGTASNRTLILSDSSIAEYTPGGVTADNINYENAKLKIATTGDRQNIISFGRSYYDSTSSTGVFGNINNPSIRWLNPLSTGTGDYDINFSNPGGSIRIESIITGASSGVNLYAEGEVSAQSASNNIHLKTNSSAKGVFADVASAGAGFLEVSNNSLTPVNQSNPYFYVDSIGAGIGIGTGQFLSTGPEARKLSVAGNTSISTTGTDHTSSLFIGDPSSVNYGKGTLYVAGYMGVGNQSPISGNGLNTTGTSEAVNVFPSIWATSQTYGNVLQVKNSPLSTYTSRTLIGDGAYDSTIYPVLTDRLSGTGPDLTQEMFLGPGYTFASGNRPLISYQQKISNATNTTGTAPVFAISTFSNGSTTYNHTSSFGLETRIQTRNTNTVLTLLANSTTSPDRNAVRIGASNSYEIAVFSGPSGSNASYGTVTVGWNAYGNPGTTGPLGGSAANFNTLNTKGAVSNSLNRDLHALTVSGIQTIGTSSPETLIRKQQVEIYKLGTIPIYGTAGGPYSMLKVHRNLFTFTQSSKGVISATGDNVNGGAYPNGLEITSYIGGPNDPTSGSITAGNRRTSSAIIVGATRDISTTPGAVGLYANPTGFFVSDTGTNVGIGTHWNYGSVLSLDVAGASWSGVTSKALNATGSVDIVGNLSVTGNANVVGDVNVTGDVSVTGDFSVKTGTTSIGIGSPYLTTYVGKILFANASSASVLSGEDHLGIPITISPATPFVLSLPGSQSVSSRVTVNLPTPMPTSNIVVVSTIEVSSSGIFPSVLNALTYSRVINQSSFEIYVGTPNIPDLTSTWTNIRVGFIAYCLP